MQRIGKLDDNVIHLPGEGWVPNQGQAELRVLSRPVPLSETNQVRGIKSCKHGLYRVLPLQHLFRGRGHSSHADGHIVEELLNHLPSGGREPIAQVVQAGF
jgi:hypothetical protein